MKRRLLPLLLLAGVAALPLHRAQAQEKPVLNTAPPGPLPAPPRPVEAAPAPARQPAPEPEPTSPPAAQPTKDSPSGLNFPNRNLPQSGSGADKPQTKMFVYTNIGLGFSSFGSLSRFNVSAAPALGYRITEKLAAGPGISYAYSSYSLNSNSQGALNIDGDKSVRSSSIGFKAFAQYIVYKEFFVHTEYEVTKAELIDFDPNYGYYKYKRTASTLLGGAGYRQAVSENAAIDLVLLYNFSSSIYSLYPPLVYRVSFLFNIGR